MTRLSLCSTLASMAFISLAVQHMIYIRVSSLSMKLEQLLAAVKYDQKPPI